MAKYCEVLKKLIANSTKIAQKTSAYRTSLMTVSKGDRFFMSKNDFQIQKQLLDPTISKVLLECPLQRFEDQISSYKAKFDFTGKLLDF